MLSNKHKIVYNNPELERLNEHYENINAISLQSRFLGNFDDNTLLVVIDDSYKEIAFCKKLTWYLKKYLPK
jgi:hypothetical protein